MSSLGVNSKSVWNFKKIWSTRRGTNCLFYKNLGLKIQHGCMASMNSPHTRTPSTNLDKRLIYIKRYHTPKLNLNPQFKIPLRVLISSIYNIMLCISNKVKNPSFYFDSFFVACALHLYSNLPILWLETRKIRSDCNILVL